MTKPMLIVGGISLTSIPAVIVKEFQPFEAKLIKPDDVKNFEVIDDDSANLANIKLREIVAIENELDEKRKSLKDPINTIAAAIQSEARKYSGVLETSKNILNTKVTNYKNLRIAQLRAEEESKRLIAEKDIERKRIIVNRMSSILIQFRAMLFGGAIFLKGGGSKPVAKPETVADLEKIKEIVIKTFPSFDIFEEYRGDIAIIYDNFLKDIENYKKYIEVGNANAIKELLLKYNKACNIADEKIEKVVEKEELKLDRTIQSEYTDALKGLREHMKFTVTNKAEVPENYKVINDVFVNNYIRANKPTVMKAIKDGKADSLVPGIHFYIEKINAIR